MAQTMGMSPPCMASVPNLERPETLPGGAALVTSSLASTLAVVLAIATPLTSPLIAIL